VRGIAVLVVLLILLPLHSRLTFSPSAVAAGEWWRVLTHPFVHVSWYHALLDGAAFLLLYRMINGPRVAYCVGAGAGSLLAAVWFWPAIGATGLCGLSGIAHGLMAVSALQMIRSGMEGHAPSWPSAPANADATKRVPPTTVGWVCLALVAGKSIWEAATGQVFFAWMHFGLLGTPVAVCHLGGVVGGVVVFAVNQWRDNNRYAGTR
jgi:rhomboid family GlyGly-CTERM serine protease